MLAQNPTWIDNFQIFHYIWNDILNDSIFGMIENLFPSPPHDRLHQRRKWQHVSSAPFAKYVISCSRTRWPYGHGGAAGLISTDGTRWWGVYTLG